MRPKILMILLFFVPFSLSLAQEGIVRGTIFDASTGEFLPGVSIFAENTTRGTLTDLDGKFSLALPAGDYNLKMSYISYKPVILENVKITSTEVNYTGEIGLTEATIELNEVVVSANAIHNTETALLTIKKKSANVMDGISAASFRKTGDSDAASSMKRVSGVSIEGGKYVYVRGLGDRYTKIVLNGVEIPGLDPDRNTIQMDIFPSNVIDNIIVHKSFSADLPADFTGGVVDINTKGFPEEKTGSISLSAGYTPGMHFNKEFVTYEGGDLDILGFDDGSRDIPATSNLPFFSEVVGNPKGQKAERYREILTAFNPNMAAYREQSFMDYSAGFTFGNQHQLEKVSLGYNLAFSYKNNTEFYESAEFGRYGLGDSNIYQMDVREYQVGDYGVNSVLLSGLAGFAVKSLHSKYRINLLHLQNGESKAGIFDYYGSDQGSYFTGIQHNLDYSQRSLSNLLIDGEHNLKDSKWSLNWKLSPTYVVIENPDVRFTRYEVLEDGGYSIGTEVGFPQRIWRRLEEIDFAGIFHVNREFLFNGQKARLKFGGAYTFKERDYVIRSFALNIRDIPLTGNPDELFYPENLWPYQGSVGRGTGYEARFVPNNPNKFNASTNNVAAYISTEINLLRNLQSVIGLRLENYTQNYTGENQQQDYVLDNERVLDNLGFFPSVNLIYSLTEAQNLRLSYSKTIARPSFKELSYAEIYDPITDRNFVGGLFRDDNELAGVVYWDGNLVSTDIHNFDLRWELFAEKGQMFSLSTFYKKFYNPIEIVQYATQTGSFQPRNVGDGEVYGGEAEFRLNLGSIIERLRNLHITSNITITESRIKLSKTEYESRIDNKRARQTVGEYRDMAGQAPYIINSGLSFSGGSKGFWNEFEAGLFYNVQGQTLLYAGIVDRPDIYTEPFHSLNLNAAKRFGKDNRISIGLKVENILADNKESVFKSFRADDRYFERLDQGVHYKLSFSYSLF